MVHARLEGGWSMGESKKHDQELVVTIVAMKGCFGNVLIPQLDLVVP